MDSLYDLKEMLMDEIQEIADKGQMTAGDLETVHKLTDTVKNIDKICMLEDDGGYSRDGRMMYDDGGSSYRRGSGRYSREMNGGYSGARRRDRMGRYSRDGMVDKLREMMDDAGSTKEKEAIRKAIDQIERM